MPAVSRRVEAGRLLTSRKAAKKASTLISDRGRIRRHIIPLLGRKSVASVTRSEVEAFVHSPITLKTNLASSCSSVARTVGLLGAIFTYAARRGFVPIIPPMASSGSPMDDGNDA